MENLLTVCQKCGPDKVVVTCQHPREIPMRMCQCFMLIIPSLPEGSAALSNASGCSAGAPSN